MILNGEELHRLCAQRGLLVLLYVGFNTNACTVMRDYGVYAMSQRAYTVVVVRDCTTGMETNETTKELICTRGQIATVEQFGVYAVTAGEVAEAIDGGR